MGSEGEFITRGILSFGDDAGNTFLNLATVEGEGVIDGTGIISESISKPINMLSSLVSGAKLGSTIASIISKKKKDI